MKTAVKLAILIGVVIFGATVTGWPSRPATAVDQPDNRFVGNWKLVSFYWYPADGDPIDRGMTGRIMYDAAGNMAAQLMPKKVETEERTTTGYVAYFGTYKIDTEAGTVTHSVAGSNLSRWVGTDLVRHFAFEDGRLSLSLKDDNGRVMGTLTWERAE